MKTATTCLQSSASSAKSSKAAPQTLWFYDEVGHTQDAKRTLLEMGVLKDQEATMTPKPGALYRES